MSTEFSFGPFVLDTRRGKLFRDGDVVPVSSKGLRLLEALVRSPGRVLSKAELIETAWGDAAIEESNLSVQVAALRKQLGPAPDGGDWITTIPRVGYRFVGAPAQESASEVGARLTGPTEPQSRPSIAVLPFVNVSGEKEQEY